MNSLIEAVAIEERGGFLARQFSASQTQPQLVFDVIFGVLMPLFCFYFDPGIMYGTFGTPLCTWSIAVYLLSAIAILGMMCWLVRGREMRRGAGFFSGIFFAGAIYSFSIGVIILPLTAIGLLIVIGLLGLVPFLTGFVYLRNGVRAMEDFPRSSRSPLALTVLLTAVVAVGLPVFVQWRINALINESLAEVIAMDARPAEEAIDRLKRLHSLLNKARLSGLVSTDRIVNEYEAETNAARRERLARAYKEITSEELEARLRSLKD